MAEVPVTKVAITVSSSQVAAGYFWPLARPVIVMAKEYTIAIIQ